MFHVTNGDSAVHRLRAAGIEGEILPWRDVLHEGPVRADLPRDAQRRLRARFIAGSGLAGDADAVERDLAARDAALDAALESARAGEELVLWFEHDLYDQLQLLEVLHRVAAVPGARVSLVQADDYLGTMPPDAVRSRFAARAPVSEAQRALATRAWAAFGAADPRAVEALLADDTRALPFLADALRRHLEELPATGDGLSRSERQLLRALADGHATLADSYQAAHHRSEPRIFLGDSLFAWYLTTLGAGPTPLLAREDGAPLVMPPPDDARAFWRSRARLTPLGEAVLRGDADRVQALGIDRWLGGVHLVGHEVAWRWDGAAVRAAH